MYKIVKLRVFLPQEHCCHRAQHCSPLARFPYMLTSIYLVSNAEVSNIIFSFELSRYKLGDTM